MGSDWQKVEEQERQTDEGRHDQDKTEIVKELRDGGKITKKERTVGGRTMLLCVAQFWSIIKDTNKLALCIIL